MKYIVSHQFVCCYCIMIMLFAMIYKLSVPKMLFNSHGGNIATCHVDLFHFDVVCQLTNEILFYSITQLMPISSSSHSSLSHPISLVSNSPRSVRKFRSENTLMEKYLSCGWLCLKCCREKLLEYFQQTNNVLSHSERRRKICWKYIIKHLSFSFFE